MRPLLTQTVSRSHILLAVTMGAALALLGLGWQVNDAHLGLALFLTGSVLLVAVSVLSIVALIDVYRNAPTMPRAEWLFNTGYAMFYLIGSLVLEILIATGTVMILELRELLAPFLP